VFYRLDNDKIQPAQHRVLRQGFRQVGGRMAPWTRLGL